MSSWRAYQDPYTPYGNYYPAYNDPTPFYPQENSFTYNQGYNEYPNHYRPPANGLPDYPGPSNSGFNPQEVANGAVKRRPPSRPQWGGAYQPNRRNDRYGGRRGQPREEEAADLGDNGADGEDGGQRGKGRNRGAAGNKANYVRRRMPNDQAREEELAEVVDNSRDLEGNGQRNKMRNRGAEGGKMNYMRYEPRNGQQGGGKFYNGGNRWQKSYRPVGEDNAARGDYNSRQAWRRNEYGNKKCGNNGRDKKKLDAASQRERLEQLLSRRQLECIVCYEKIKHTDKTWSCELCYHILHLACTIEWAKSSTADNTWRCPACQHPSATIPTTYTCFCTKALNPRPLPGVVPHSCGDACLRKGRTCPHNCTILCHPGPCPDCSVLVPRSCGCGAITQTVKCSSDVTILCESICGKQLDCAMHTCTQPCHIGECDPCTETIQQVCYCEKQGRKVTCTKDLKGSTQYECGDHCQKALSCTNHKCELKCHPGPCQKCDGDTELVTTCPCGQTALREPRTNCLDPIPTCNLICTKVLACGPPSTPHTCANECHSGPCPPCPLQTKTRCRCGHMNKFLDCAMLQSKADDARCEVKCTKKRTCGKHRCNQRCCIELDHQCTLPCNHLLACGHHRCARTCHSGRCPPCTETSFEELYCECGAQVAYPPIACGRKPPPCDRPCSRPRACAHEPLHNCHTGACPPCTVLCRRFCHGRHEQRAAIACHREAFGCGLACGRPLPCGEHRCDKACHAGECALPCKQRCQAVRKGCGHGCGAVCHRGACPRTACRARVAVTCACGLLKGQRGCVELAEVYREMEVARLNEKMADLGKEQSVDISDLVQVGRKVETLRILECNEECKVFERNRRLAIGLQIRNPDLTQKLMPRYSDFMRAWAKKDAPFCRKIHDKLTELVRLAKVSKQKSRAHSFESMNRDKRQLVHEYCEHFGVESAAYDQEPNRNVVATASRERSWLPSMGLLEVMQRENGQRKVPGPVLGAGKGQPEEAVALRVPGRGGKAPEVDYFTNLPL